jgi:hypothetical protein
MARKYNTKHDERGRSSYGRKTSHADRYGQYDNGVQKTADRLVTVKKTDVDVAA